MATTAPSTVRSSGSPGVAGRLARRWPVVALGAWNAFVFTTRISNVLADDQASAATKTWSIALAVVMLVGVVALAAVLVTARSRPWRAAEARVVQVVAGLTAVVWVIRGIEIATADYAGNRNIPNPAGFKAVHLVLGIIAIVLAALSWRAAGRDRAGVVDEPGDEPGTPVSPVREAVR
jgi:hypothetical protein